MSDAPETCPDCGAEIPAGGWVDGCPRCLLAGSLDEDAVTIAGAAGNTPSGKPEIEVNPSPNATISMSQELQSGAAAYTPSVEEMGAVFPELEILELLGAGGMGAVYKGRQPRLDRLVAVKILGCPPEHRESFAIRFEREAQVLAKLNHPHIVSIFDFGERDWERNGESELLFYFLMEFVDGADLSRLIGTGELTPAQALAIVPQICDALQFAHDKGITHRDIKPANILVDQEGTVRIADFGLAKLIESGQETVATGLTMTGTSMGTPHYMAPEQWETPDQVDHRADIYSLGVVFYEMLTGERPQGIFAAPSKKVAVDDNIDSVVFKAMEKEIGNRYQHASEVREDVTRVQAPLTESKKPRGKFGRVGIAMAATIVFVAVVWLLRPQENLSGSGRGEFVTLEPKNSGSDPAPGQASEPFGHLRGWGEAPIITEALEKTDGIKDIVQVGIDSRCWLALRSDGTTMSNRSEFDGLTTVQSIDPGCRYVIHRNGQITWRNEKDFSPILPDQLKPVRKITLTLGDTSQALPPGLLLYEDGSIAAFALRSPPSRHREKEEAWLARAKKAIGKIDDAVDLDVWSQIKLGCIARADGSVVVLNLERESGLHPGESSWKDIGNIQRVTVHGWGSILGLNEEGEVIPILGTSSQMPATVERVTDLVAHAGTKAARTEEGRWIAWGSPRTGTELNAAINDLPPTPQIQFYAHNEYKNTGLVWIEPATETSIADTVYPTDEAEFRGWLDGKVFQPANASPTAAFHDLFWIGGDRLHWLGIPRDEDRPNESKSWSFDVPEPGTITWKQGGNDDGLYRIQVFPDGKEYDHMANNRKGGWHGSSRGLVRDELSPPGRLRALGTTRSGEEADISEAEGFDDFIDVAGGNDHWVALRANGETISYRGLADYQNIRSLCWSFAQHFALIDRNGKIHFPADIRPREVPPSFDAEVFIDVKLGYDHGIALTEDGRALVFGERYQETVSGALPDVPTSPLPPEKALIDVQAIAATHTHAATLKSDGTLSIFGWEGPLNIPDVKDLAKIKAIESAGHQFRLLDENNQLWRIHVPRRPDPNTPLKQSQMYSGSPTRLCQSPRFAPRSGAMQMGSGITNPAW